MSAIRGLKNSMPLDSKLDAKAQDEKLREVADMYEKFFIKELMRHMKSSLSEDGGMIKKNNAEKIFSEQLDEQYSAEWNKRGGFGMSEMIYNNVKDRYAEQFAATGTAEKPPEFNHEQMLWQIDQQTKASKK